MSFLPIFNSLMFGVIVAGLFLWNLSILLLILPAIAVSVVFFWFDLLNWNFHYESAFWLFILSEAIAFGSLLVSCFWFDNNSFIALSSSLEIPFMGCFLLLGSSISITGFHHVMFWPYSWLLLLLTTLLGSGFVLLQLFEFNEIFINLIDSSFYASCFCTVGLHFLHVFVGVIGLSMVLYLGVKSAGIYRCTVVTWYWHFVDYIWLLVYACVYVC
uniref:Cytochrome c oxidase subunit 3 n=1 Tax=Ligula intestinalis TaxID=94845 RepID=A0A346HGX7_LIGIN|nr:cytochrome c oxidase subunit III [Ligula intestinalis]AXO78663.1 cytochrome c oxidase subunit 3 [Ligula intestinalis]